MTAGTDLTRFLRHGKGRAFSWKNMATSHNFDVIDLNVFLADLEGRGYQKTVVTEHDGEVTTFSKALSDAVTKQYSFHSKPFPAWSPVHIRVTYQVLRNGKPLKKLTRHLTALIEKYRKAIPKKTTPKFRKGLRHKHWLSVVAFKKTHRELIDCFQYPAFKGSEGNFPFNMIVGSTPEDRETCTRFVYALLDALAPQGIIQGRRESDVVIEQRNTFIHSYFWELRKKQWTGNDAAKEIKKELSRGTWDGRRSGCTYDVSIEKIRSLASGKPRRFNAHSMLKSGIPDEEIQKEL